MHDAKGRPLSVGDTVLIPARVTELQESEDYCNVSVETLVGRRPDGEKEHIHAINTGVLFRDNEGDVNNDYEPIAPSQPSSGAEQPASAAA